jgi:AcrR family transcriptional regulator
VTGQSQSDIAAAAGVSVRTLRRRQREPEVIRAVAEARADQTRLALGRLSTLRCQALVELEALLNDDNPTTRLRAVRLVLEQTIAHQQSVAAERSEELERLATQLHEALEALGETTE